MGVEGYFDCMVVNVGDCSSDWGFQASYEFATEDSCGYSKGQPQSMNWDWDQQSWGMEV